MALAPLTVQNMPELEPGTDHRFASSLDHTRADKEMPATKRGVAHALRVAFEVFCLGHLGIVEMNQ